jgi:hypothetical protein
VLARCDHECGGKFDLPHHLHTSRLNGRNSAPALTHLLKVLLGEGRQSGAPGIGQSIKLGSSF